MYHVLKITLLLATFFVGLNLQAQDTEKTMNLDPYTKEWKTIDSLSEQGLYQSALDGTKLLYETAKADKENPHIILALIYQIRFIQQLEEEGTWKALRFLEKEIERLKGTNKAIVQSILAQRYYNYFAQNRWQIQQRTPTEEQPDDDPTNWTTTDLVQHSTQLYIQSIEELTTRNESIDAYEALIDKGENTDQFLPSVYDVLLYRAINHFSLNTRLLGEFYKPKALNSPVLLANQVDFITNDFGFGETLSTEERVVRLFQESLQWRAEKGDADALVDLNLRRLTLMHTISNQENKNSVYQKALTDLKTKYAGTRHEKEILLAQMELAYKLGGEYRNPATDDEKRWEWKNAYEIGQDIINRFPDSYAAQQAANKCASLLYPQFSHQSEEVYLPGKHGLLKVNFQNRAEAYFKIIEIENEDYLVNNKDTDWLNRLSRRRAVQQWDETLPNPGDLRMHSAETSFKPLPTGVYLLISSDNKDFDETQGIVNWSEFWVSKIGMLSSGREEEKSQLITMDRETGAPLPGVRITTWNQRKRQGNWSQGRTVRTDGHGRALINQGETNYNYQLQFQHGRDELFVQQRLYGLGRTQKVFSRRRTAFFLDRSIYRPGQPIHFKAILTDYHQDATSTIVPNQEVTITLADVNGQDVTKLTLTSNAYGTVSGTFTAPEGVLLGYMSLRSDQGSDRHRFSVEEYKRPRFSVEMDPLEGTPKLSGEVKITGSAISFAGPAVAGAKVTYQISRSSYFPWFRWGGYGRYYPQGNDRILVTGETVTDEEGRFEITFLAEEDESINKRQYPQYNFSINADVVDLTGETRTGSTNIRLARNPLVATINLPENQDRSENIPLAIVAKNLDDQPVEIKGNLKVERLESPDQVFLKRYWEKPDLKLMNARQFKRHFPDFAYDEEDETSTWKTEATVLEEAINVNGKHEIDKDISDWQTGYYRWVFSTITGDGDTLKVEQIVEISDKEKGDFPSVQPLIANLQKTSYEPGEEVQLEVITPKNAGYLFVEISREWDILVEQWEFMNPSAMVTFPVEEEHRGGFVIQTLHIRKNRVTTNSFAVQVPWTNKELDISYETFRNKLYPNQQEEWIIKIEGPDKDAFAAELLAGMYDASLDEIKSHSWNFVPFNNRAYSHFNWYQRSFYLQNSRNLNHLEWEIPNAPRRKYPSLRGLSYAEMQFLHTRSIGGLMSRSAGISSAPDEYAERTAETAYFADGVGNQGGMAHDLNPNVVYKESVEEKGGLVTEEGFTPPTEIRKNLQETAFFFPHLMTDEEGRVILKFTTPESLTKWRLMLFGHTKELAYGFSENEMTTQKELMILPNAPRFLREDDELSFTAKVSNLSEKILSGKASLEFFDLNAGTNLNALLGLTENEINFNINPSQSDGLSWTLNVPKEAVGLIGYRVKATAGQFSDGEESALPVLSNQILLTETLPLFARSGETSTFKLAHLIEADENTRHQSLKLEMTTNPVWVAVKSLPYLMEYPHDCTEQLVNRFFANAVAANIVEKHPEIEAVFEEWRRDENALESPLMQNQDLKSVVLEETPWVMEAQEESKQRQRIARLFDTELMQNEATVAMTRLSQRQLSSGGFSWFPGGQESWYITQYVVEELVKLKALGIQLSENTAMREQLTNRAFTYCQNEVIAYYQRLVENASQDKIKLEENNLSHLIIHFIYVQSHLATIPRSEEANQALNYFLNQAKKYWTSLGLYEQGLLTIAFYQMEEDEAAQSVFASLRERARRSEELGMYWKYNEGYTWNQRPLETHTVLMDAFKYMEATQAEQDEMALWLLRNKETNRWETTKATASAIYAILQTAGQSLKNGGEVQVSFPKVRTADYKEVLATAQQSAEAGSGYYELQWDADQIEPDYGTVKIRNKEEHPIWGGLYWQYFKALDQVETFEGTPLKVERQLLKVTNTAEGKQLTELAEAPKPGDLLKVRLVVRTDRDMEFLHLKDLRASGLEPVQQISTYQYQDGLGYYQSTTDVATHFFFDQLPKGEYVLEYELRVFYEGDFSGGISTLQCMYAPKFSSHSSGARLLIRN